MIEDGFSAQCLAATSRALRETVRYARRQGGIVDLKWRRVGLKWEASRVWKHSLSQDALSQPLTW